MEQYLMEQDQMEQDQMKQDQMEQDQMEQDQMEQDQMEQDQMNTVSNQGILTQDGHTDLLYEMLSEIRIEIHDQMLPLRVLAYIAIPTIVAYILFLGQKVFIPIIVSFALAYLIISLTKALEKAFGKILPKSNFSKISFILSIGIYLAAIVMIVVVTNNNIKRLVSEADVYQEKLKSTFDSVVNLVGIQDHMNWQELASRVDIAGIINTISRSFMYIVGNGLDIVLYTSFLLAGWKNFPLVIKAMCDYKGWETGRFESVSGKINNAIQEYINIKIIVSLMTAALSYVLMKIMGLELAFFWATLAFVLNFIPTIGSIVAATIPSLIALIQFGVTQDALIISTGLIFIQFLIGNIIEPKMMGKSLNLNSFMILVFLATWGNLWGVVGMLLCVPIMVIMLIAFKEFETTGLISIILSEDGNIFSQNKKLKIPSKIAREYLARRRLKKSKNRSPK